MYRDMISKKPKESRVRESVTLLKKFTQLGIPLTDPGVRELKQHLDEYIKEGTCWQGNILFYRFGRMAEVNLPEKAEDTIEVTLKAVKTEPRLNDD